MVVPSVGAWALLMAAAAPSGGDLPPERDDAVEVVRLNLAVGDQCSELSSFWAQVRARTERVRAAAVGEKARVFSVSASLNKGKALGRLVITEPGGEETVRELDAETCGEVVAGLALIAAIAVDPDARTEPLQEIPSEAPEATPAESSQAAPAAEVIQKPLNPPVSAVPEREPSQPVRGPKAALVLQGQARPMSGVPIFYGASLALELDTVSSAVFSPLLRFGGAWSGGVDAIHTRNGSARFEWLTARIALCPVRYPRRSSGRVDICVHGELGALSGRGFDVERPQTASRLWAAAGGALRAQLDLAGAFFVEAEGWADFGLYRPSFQFRPATAVLHVPLLVPGAAIGAGARF